MGAPVAHRHSAVLHERALALVLVATAGSGLGLGRRAAVASALLGSVRVERLLRTGASDALLRGSPTELASADVGPATAGSSPLS